MKELREQSLETTSKHLKKYYRKYGGDQVYTEEIKIEIKSSQQ